MNLIKWLFSRKRDPVQQTEVIGEPVAKRLTTLMAQLESLEEPKCEGIETKEFYQHRACVAVARMLACLPDTPGSNADRKSMFRLWKEYTSEHYGEGLDFKHPWTERIKILKEIYHLLFANATPADVFMKVDQNSATLSREWQQFFDSVRLHTTARTLASLVGDWPKGVSPSRLTQSNWGVTIRRVNEFLTMPYPGVPNAKPEYKVVDDGKIARKSNAALDFMICSVLPKGQPVNNQPNVLVWRLIEHYSRWPLARLIFLLPQFERVSQAATNSAVPYIVAEHVNIYIYTGVENTLFAAYEALPEGGRLSDEAIQQELLKLI